MPCLVTDLETLLNPVTLTAHGEQTKLLNSEMLFLIFSTVAMQSVWQVCVLLGQLKLLSFRQPLEVIKRELRDPPWAGTSCRPCPTSRNDPSAAAKIKRQINNEYSYLLYICACVVFQHLCCFLKYMCMHTFLSASVLMGLYASSKNTIFTQTQHTVYCRINILSDSRWKGGGGEPFREWIQCKCVWDGMARCRRRCLILTTPERLTASSDISALSDWQDIQCTSNTLTESCSSAKARTDPFATAHIIIWGKKHIVCKILCKSLAY